jgi:hypothetical protein
MGIFAYFKKVDCRFFTLQEIMAFLFLSTFFYGNLYHNPVD